MERIGEIHVKRGWDKTSLLDKKTDCINGKFDAARFFTYSRRVLSQPLFFSNKVNADRNQDDWPKRFDKIDDAVYSLKPFRKRNGKNHDDGNRDQNDRRNQALFRVDKAHDISDADDQCIDRPMVVPKIVIL